MAASVSSAELWGIRHALKLAKEKNWMEVTVEPDSQVAIHLIMKEDVEYHPDETIVEDCKVLKEETKAIIKHTLCEANKCG